MPLEELLSIGRIVDPVIREYLARGASDPFKPIILHQFEAGGKRVRAALAILSCEASGGSRSMGLNGAAFVELIHNYSLLVDDIIDRGEVRRGLPTTRALYSDAMALLAAMFYRESLEELVEACRNPGEVRRIIVSTIKELIEGERLDILMEQAGRGGYLEEKRLRSAGVRDYMYMIGKKTAALIKASCEIGCVEAGAPRDLRDALSKYGWSIGLAFQVVDDYLDIYGEETGKAKGKDIQEHKLGNIVILYALEALPESMRSRLLSILSESTVSSEDLDEALRLMDITDAKDRCRRLALRLVEEGKGSLSPLPDTDAKRGLLELADFIAYRTY
ncbi:MAG: polyprenyl synthetase family protein [Candidatus Bathyarchaeia archaeon]